MKLDEILIGTYGLSVILTVIMGIVYKFFEKADGTSSLPDKWKTLAVTVVGVALSIVGLLYKEGCIPSAKMAIDYAVTGFMSGATSIGLWKVLGSVNGGGK
jgi:uncharacterized membrane-anchored protein